MSDQVTIAERVSALKALDINGRVLGLLHLGIEGCAAKNAEQVRAAVEGLADEIIDDPEIDKAFRRTYGYCLEWVGKGYFEAVAYTLADLLPPVDIREPEAGGP